jgi:hypothetical protein
MSEVMNTRIDIRVDIVSHCFQGAWSVLILILKHEIFSGQFGEMTQERPGLKARGVRNWRAFGSHSRSLSGE